MNDLSVLDPDLGFAPCPYAKKAFNENKLKVVGNYSGTMQEF